jgi:hypothetical protein
LCGTLPQVPPVTDGHEGEKIMDLQILGYVCLWHTNNNTLPAFRDMLDDLVKQTVVTEEQISEQRRWLAAFGL